MLVGLTRTPWPGRVDVACGWLPGGALAWLLLATMPAFAADPQTEAASAIRETATTSSRITTTLEIQLLTDSDNAPLFAQRWRTALEPYEVGLNVRRAAADEKPETREVLRGTLRMVTAVGLLDRRGDAIFADRKFALSDREAIKEWIDELKLYGAEGGPEGKPFWGLPEAAYQNLLVALSKPVEVQSSGQEVHHVIGQLPLPSQYAVRWSTAAEAVLNEPVLPATTDEAAPPAESASETSGPATTARDPFAPDEEAAPASTDPAPQGGRKRTSKKAASKVPVAPLPRATGLGRLVTEEINGFSLGTAMAMALNDVGLGFRPTRTPSGAVELAVEPLGSSRDHWPVGWPLKDSRMQSARELFRLQRIEISQQKFTDVVLMAEEKSGVPICWDRAAIATQKLTPNDVTINVPLKQTSWALVLRTAAFQARLSREIWEDESGRTFVWLSPLKRATDEPRR